MSAAGLSANRVAPEHTRLDGAIDAAAKALIAAQRADGHWVYDLEADATIPAEYVLMRHYLSEPEDAELERKIGVYLRRIQGAHGGWPLVHAGPLDVSASVKAYFALKMIGDDIDAPHMARARHAILACGGAERVNVFTRILLALFGEVSWRAVPVMPVEILLLPRWFPFHLEKISYWARTVIAPLLVLGAVRPRARNPKGVGVAELFVGSPQSVGLPQRSGHQHRGWFAFFRCVDVILRRAEPLFPKRTRRRAIDAAVRFVTERLNGEDGLGAIFPAMVNAALMYDALDFPSQHPDRLTARRSIDKLVVETVDEAWCQPCFSPVWDTALASHALMEVGGEPAMSAATRGLRWLTRKQILDVMGDWASRRPNARPGGWAFQYANAYYPDLDDTAVIVMAMDRMRRARTLREFDTAIERGCDWVRSMQSRNGGWGAFDADNTYSYLNNIPFSDHGALLDPPTDDVTARCVSMLEQIEHGAACRENAERGREFLLRSQLPEGSWYGRWGMNYIYGTWSALCALALSPQDDRTREAMRRAGDWLLGIQNDDGGWGEDATSYALDRCAFSPAESLPSQTAWALLGLMAAGRTQESGVRRGIDYLQRAQNSGGDWDDIFHNATGFPRVFYLRYHGYARYFPLWTLARYRALGQGAPLKWGM